MKKIKVLITGGGGFLGQYIAGDLLKENYEVYSFQRSSNAALKMMGVTERLGNLINYDDVKSALNGMDAVIHTASKVGMWGRYQDFYQTNVVGTENILMAMKELKIKNLVYTSTPSVVFSNENLCGVDESTPYPTTYLNFYAQTKAMAEKKVLAANSCDLKTIALRPHLIFGPGDKNLIPRLITAQLKGRLKIIGTGDNLVDVTYVENASYAHCLALKHLINDHNPTIYGKAYFLGQGPVLLWDFINTILKKNKLSPVTKKISLKKAYWIGFMIESILKLLRIYNIHPPMTRFVAMQLATSHYFSHKNLENDLGYRPIFTIEEGLYKLFSKA